MKKALFLISLASVLFGCSKEIPQEPQAEEHVTLDFSIQDGELPDTKTVKKSWSNNDRIYIFFDGEITENPEYLVIKYDKGAFISTWVPDSWTSGLESKIYHKTSGTLCAFYMPNDQMGGSISLERKYLSSSYSYVYSMKATDRKGEEFHSVFLTATDVPYTVSNGTLTASFKVSASKSSIQFSIPRKDRDGNTIKRSDSHNYFLSTDKLAYSTSVYRFSGTSFSGQGTPNGKMSAYMFQYTSWGNTYTSDLCFSGWKQGDYNTEWYFHFWDYNKKEKYLLRATFNPASGSAFTLPALNEQDSAGKYRWEFESSL